MGFHFLLHGIVLSQGSNPCLLSLLVDSLPLAWVAQTVKNLPAIQEAKVQSLSQEDPLEKGMDTHSSILAWEIPWTEEPGGLYSPCGLGVRRD